MKSNKRLMFLSEYKKDIGVLKSFTYELDSGVIPMPADKSIYAIFVISGSGSYERVSISEGDVVLLGLSKSPIIGYSNRVSLFIMELEYLLFYFLTGMTPKMGRYVIKLEYSNPLSELCRMLKEFPSSMWRFMAENYIKTSLTKEKYKSRSTLERMCYASRKLQHNYSIRTEELAKDIGISSRQLQRGFKDVFGMTVQEYQRITRFQYAMSLLLNHSLSSSAYLAGYYDQSHMIKEFGKMSPWKPLESKEFIPDLLPIKE